jgi:hypothetical protein
MVDLIASPEPHRLLPPLLACLPTAFASHRPPPALLPLVSPILRQRLQLNTSTSGSPSENWLRLLCWNSEKADKLKDVVESGTFEPHPSSGEIEVGDIGAIKYKRLDQETLRAQIVLSDWSLTALYLWCGDEEGGDGWKLSELLPYDGELERNSTWSQSMTEANETSRERIVSEAIREAEAAEQFTAGQDDDDDYWAQYDKSPGRTPAQTRSPAPDGIPADRRGGQSEGDHYAQYGDVQPAMDNHDPSEESNELDESSLRGDILASIMRRQTADTGERAAFSPKDLERAGRPVGAAEAPVSQPQASPSSSASSNAVARLEERADQQSASEVGIRQHISTTMKSLYRLAKSAGMEREEFDGVVQRELETNSIFDE